MSPQSQTSGGWSEPKATALLVLADGTVLEGIGLGATGSAVACRLYSLREPHYEPSEVRVRVTLVHNPSAGDEQHTALVERSIRADNHKTGLL